MNVDFVDANTPAQAESLLYCLERAAVGIDLHVNADKIDAMCFNQRADIYTLNGVSLKLVKKFTISEAASHLAKMTLIRD